MAFHGRGDPRKGHSGVGGRLRESREGEGEGEKRGGGLNNSRTRAFTIAAGPRNDGEGDSVLGLPTLRAFWRR